jgi:hypothetical protein
MAAPLFYNQGDQAIYDSGQFFIPQEQYRLSYNAPIIEEEQESSIGIPNTNSFRNFSNSDNRNFSNNSFQPYTAQPSGSFVTNRTDYGISGYIPGTEPEETFMDKAGNLIARGIGAAIPGGNFLLGMVDKLDRFDDLSAQDKAFAEMQMGINEIPYHGMGNLPNQDRYGYNKRSMLGNYANVVSERVDIANKRLAEGKTLRPIDNYYLQKQKEEEDVKNQINLNNEFRQMITANNIRNRIKNDPTYNEKFNIHTDGGNTITPPTIITPTNLNDYSGRDHAGGQAAAEAAASQAADDVAAGAGGYKRGGLASL